MKRNFKSTSAKVLAVALAVGMVATSLPATVADAKKAVKKPTLGKTKVSINVGKTKKITVKKNKGPKVKKVTIKLSKKQKKIVKITKKTKTYIKVKGLKAGKTTLKVKIKAGKKTYTQKLKVTVVKGKTPVTNTPAPTTATSNKPADSTPAASAGTGTTPAPSGATESQAPTTTPPSGPVEKTDITLKYDYTFPAARQVLFEDADEGYPSYGIDVRDYAKVIVKVAATKEIEMDSGWAGKVTLSSTDDGLGCTAYTDGLMVKYFNDVADKGGFVDGVYTFTFDINAASMGKGFELDDLELCDCIGLQLSGTAEGGPNSYDDIKLKEISFILPEGGPVTPTDPAASVEPSTPKPTIDPATETDVTKVGDDLTVVSSLSDITTLKKCKDFNGDDAIRFPFTANNQRVFFDVSDIDFTKIGSIKVTADVPAQMTFDLFSKSLDKEVDSWWNGTYLTAGYPFYNAEAGTKLTYTCTTTTADLKDTADLADVGYLALGSHNGPGGKNPYASESANYYFIYSIEFIQKEVTVTAAAAKSSFEVGETTTITSDVKLAGEATDSTITYKSSDETIATVDTDGKITGVKAGNATITVTATVDGITKPATAEVAIQIKEKSTDPSVELELQNDAPAKIGTGLTTTLDVTVRNAADAVVAYEFDSKDTGTATVITAEDGTTATVKGTKAGTVTITAKITVDSQDYKSEPVVITVVDPTVKVSAKTVDRVTVGGTIELAAAIANAGDATASYTSGAADVATVDAKGVVTGVKAGKATITATITVDEKNYTDDIEITVVPAPTADIPVTLTGATAVSFNGNDLVTTATEADGVVTMTVSEKKYDQGIKMSVTIPEGTDITDYYGISVKYKTTAVTETHYGKRVILGVVNDAEEYGASLLYDSGYSTTLKVSDTATELVAPITPQAGITLKEGVTSGTVELTFIISSGETGTYEISEVKLLKGLPTPDEGEPIATFADTGTKKLSDIGVTLDDKKTYTGATLKIKAYDKEGALIDADYLKSLSDEGKKIGGNKVAVGNSTSCGVGYGDGVAMYYTDNLKNPDADGFCTISLSLVNAGTKIDSTNCDLVSFQSSSNEKAVSKIEIYEIEFTGAADKPADPEV